MSSVIVDTNLSDACKRRLTVLGYNVIELPPYDGMSSPVASHPDTLICRIGDELITSADYCERAAYVFSDIREIHPSIRVRFCSDGLGEPYPRDCAYNALSIGIGGDVWGEYTKLVSQQEVEHTSKLGAYILCRICICIGRGRNVSRKIVEGAPKLVYKL